MPILWWPDAPAGAPRNGGRCQFYGGRTLRRERPGTAVDANFMVAGRSGGSAPERRSMPILWWPDAPAGAPRNGGRCQFYGGRTLRRERPGTVVDANFMVAGRSGGSAP